MNNIVVTNKQNQTINVNNQSNTQGLALATSHNITVVSVDGVEYKAGENILIENNTISVITTNEVEQDNTRPITSAGVDMVVGNINVLLETI